MQHWTLDRIPWHDFDPGQVDPDVLAVVKAAAMVERNAADYATYLCNVFADDAQVQADVRAWAAEEIQHGEALGRWAGMADPGFDFRAGLRRFTEGYRIPTDRTTSVRGSRTGEMIARCVVETGTSSFYSALRDATDEPVLKAICQRIAGDEFRHFKLFHTHSVRYGRHERPGLVRRARVALGRLKEADDDELAFAYHCGNAPDDQPYDHARCNAAYAARAYGLYGRAHVDRGMRMIMKAIGLKPRGPVSGLLVYLAWKALRNRVRRLSRVK